MVQENQKALSSQEQLKNERYLWIARAFSVMAVLSVLANIFLLIAIGSLVPLVRVRPYFMTVLDKNQQVVEISPPTADQLNNKEILESLIRQYVLARYTITSDVSEVEERWGTKGIRRSRTADNRHCKADPAGGRWDSCHQRHTAIPRGEILLSARRASTFRDRGWDRHREPPGRSG